MLMRIVKIAIEKLKTLPYTNEKTTKEIIAGVAARARLLAQRNAREHRRQTLPPLQLRYQRPRQECYDEFDVFVMISWLYNTF